VKVSPLSVAAGNQQCQIIGYVLGKVVQTPRPVKPITFAQSRVQDDDNGFLPSSNRDFLRPYEQLGHVTSLAIMDGYRRKGLAAHLMNQLHYEMKQCYDADAVGLHVRVSNEAATNLYAKSMGYRVDDVIPGYYQDGEDAYLMRKDFEICEENEANNLEKELEDIGDTMDAGGKSVIKRKFRFPTFTSNQFKTKKEYMLPRTVFEYNEQKIVDTSSSEIQSKSKESEEDSVSVVSASA